MNLLSTGDLSGFSGPRVALSMHLCIKVIMDTKANRPAWFICLGSDGKITLPSSDDGSWTRVCWAGVCELADVTTACTPCPAGSVTLAESAVLAGTSTAPESSTSAESSPAARSATTAESKGPAEPTPLAEPATSAESSKEMRWRLDDSCGPSLWLIRNSRCQVYLFARHLSRPWMICRVSFMASGMTLSGQEPVVDRSPGWLWGQGPVVNRSPRRMMMMRRPWFGSLRRDACWSWMVHWISTIPGAGAGASRWRQYIGSASLSHGAWASDV